jgi:DICT domain-containing protein/GGDEF domain-containing protein
LAHAARTRAERAFVDNLGAATRVARDRATGSRPERLSKRLLVDISHAVEKAVMSGRVEQPTVVVALFQRLAHFDRERAVYERMAEAGVTVVVGFVSGEEPAPPRGVDVVELAPDETMADEWTVVALGPNAGAFLVATDQHAHDPVERAAEMGRVFDGRWGFSRTQAASELARLRFALGARLDPALARIVDDLLARTMPTGGEQAGSAGAPGEMWATTSLYHMIDRMRDAHAGTRELRDQLADAHDAAGTRATVATDSATGLPTAEFLDRWAPRGGPGALQVGLALFDVAGFDDPALDDARAAYHVGHRVAAALSEPLGSVDVAVRLDRRTFAVVVPGASSRHLAELADRIAEGLALASEGHPGVRLDARIATTTTRTRPLPVGDLREALARADGSAGPVDAGPTPTGGSIVVASTAPVDDHPAQDGNQWFGTDGHDRRDGPDPDPAGRHMRSVPPDGVDGAGRFGGAEMRDNGPDTQPLPHRIAQETLGRLTMPSDVNLFDGYRGPSGARGTTTAGPGSPPDPP